MKSMVCPFCGVATEVAHRSQEACIEALQSEIARTRAILTHAANSSAIHPQSNEVADEDTDQA